MGTEWREAGEAINDQVSAELKLRVEQAESLPTVAAVSSFWWQSLNSGPAERHQILYELSLTRAEPRDDELPIPPRLPDDPPDPAGFPFRIELSQGFKTKESEEDDPESQPKSKADRAIVVGLQPTLVLAKTQNPASLPTLATALAECVSIITRNASPLPEEASPFRRPASHVPPPDAVRSKLTKTKNFLSRCSLQHFVEFIKAY